MSAKKSQVSIEFLVLISFLFVFSLAFIVAAGIQMQSFSDNKKRETIIDFGESIREEISLASVVKDGYQRALILPEKIDSTINYSINNTNSTLVIETEIYEFNAIIPQTAGELKKGQNIIKNVNNSVVIENV